MPVEVSSRDVSLLIFDRAEPYPGNVETGGEVIWTWLVCIFIGLWVSCGQEKHMSVIVAHSDSFCAIVHNTRLHDMIYVCQFAICQFAFCLEALRTRPSLPFPWMTIALWVRLVLLKGPLFWMTRRRGIKSWRPWMMLFFFKPVEGSMGHHTILGDQPIEFDCIAKPFRAKAAEFSGAEMNNVTLVQGGSPLTFSLTNIQFDVLSKNLFVWTEMDIDYRVILAMLLDLWQAHICSVVGVGCVDMCCLVQVVDRLDGFLWGRHVALSCSIPSQLPVLFGTAHVSFFVSPEVEELDWLLDQCLVNRLNSVFHSQHVLFLCNVLICFDDGAFFATCCFSSVCCKVGKHLDSEIDTFNITEKGQRSLVVTQTSTKPRLLAEYKQIDEPGRDAKSLTEFDLVLTLAQQGWECRCQNPSKKIAPYTVLGPKIWYYHQNNAKGGGEHDVPECLMSGRIALGKWLGQDFSLSVE